MTDEYKDLTLQARLAAAEKRVETLRGALKEVSWKVRTFADTPHTRQDLYEIVNYCDRALKGEKK
ncbi:hypothetical protein GWO43_16130 [candidate division KSB1 bacterium]|nr:hypothetical protein [candidate division KSB1 bacterium]NIV68762.1 hypothetical protein [Phycisphaerae bacterium]NIS25479.1 hypothetical protein [candidate division KSB1 bacterium]NIT72372.1 hypothetical protein [candidate division KSB1 bacterium]NIU26156.1 hypothetical protein [candidate division KSB1 bacterium]